MSEIVKSHLIGEYDKMQDRIKTLEAQQARSVKEAKARYAKH